MVLPHRDLIVSVARGASYCEWEDCPLDRALCSLGHDGWQCGMDRPGADIEARAGMLLGWEQENVRTFIGVWDKHLEDCPQGSVYDDVCDAGVLLALDEAEKVAEKRQGI